MAKSTTLTIRLPASVERDLSARLREESESKSALAARLIEEGLRMERHPGIVFRPGPTGRRAGLQGGPDVWEAIAAVKAGDLSGDEALERAAETLGVTVEQVRLAVRYYADCPKEVDERIRANRERADRAEAAWKRERRLIRDAVD